MVMSLSDSMMRLALVTGESCLIVAVMTWVEFLSGSMGFRVTVWSLGPVTLSP